MIDITPLYYLSTRGHRYKGVYQAPNNQWDAIVQSPDGKLERKGRFSTQDEAARTVAMYYLEIYGSDWPQALKDRLRRVWRVKRIIRYLDLADLHHGPRTIVYTAEVQVRFRKWHKIVPLDIVGEESLGRMGDEHMWNAAAGGWRTQAAALVAIRMYRALHPPEPRLPAEPEAG